MIGWLCVIVVAWTAPSDANPAAVCRVANSAIYRDIVVAQDGVRTVAIGSSAGAKLEFVRGAEFVLRLMDGRELTTADYRPQSSTFPSQPASSLTLSLIPVGSGDPRVTLEFVANKELPIIRKRITVDSQEVVDWIDVEALTTDATSDLGGLGQPLFLNDRWFCGLEYPAGRNEHHRGALTARHYPGRKTFQSQWAVWGTASTNRPIRDAFFDYIERIRKPTRPVLLYNGWFDQRGDEVNPKRTKEVFHQINEQLKKHDVGLDVFQIDDGYQDPESLWQPTGNWPDAFSSMARDLESHQCALGLWLPLNGYHLDTTFGESQGWARAIHRKKCYSIVDSKYQAALRNTLAEHIHHSGVRCFKHDFNFLDALHPTSNRPRTMEHQREEGVDALVEILAYERSLDPQIQASLTTGIWLSPWWLMHVDWLWPGGGDYRHDWSFAQDGDRSAEMTNRDARLYEVLQREKLAVPVSALMTHGIIRGRHDETAPDESLKQWSDYVVMFFGRGTQLQELYLSPELMSDECGEVLAHAARWARSHALVFQRTAMIGGRPNRGEAYGYLHSSPNATMAIAVLRNPALVPAKISVDLTEVSHSSDVTWHPVVIYPHQERPEPVSGQSSFDVDLPASSVCVIHLYSAQDEILKEIPPGHFHVDRTREGLSVTRYLQPHVSRSGSASREKGHWSGSLSTDGKNVRDVTIVQRPAGGAYVHVAGAGKSRRIPHYTTDWSAESVSIEPSDGVPPSIEVSLLPSPLWPEQVRFDVIARERVVLEPAEASTKLASATSESSRDRLSWPLVLEPGVILREEVLADDERLTRRRSTLERMGWFLLVAILPIASVGAFTSRLTQSWRTGPRWFILASVSTALAATYLVTPLGTILVRCFP